MQHKELYSELSERERCDLVMGIICQISLEKRTPDLWMGL